MSEEATEEQATAAAKDGPLVNIVVIAPVSYQPTNGGRVVNLKPRFDDDGRPVTVKVPKNIAIGLIATHSAVKPAAAAKRKSEEDPAEGLE